MSKFNIIDIGSAGLLAEPWSHHPDLVGKILKFEPRDADGHLPNVKFLPYALWSKCEERDFYIYRGFGGTGSSLFQQNFRYVAANFPDLKRCGNARWAQTWFERSGEVERKKLVCRTLDWALAEIRNGGHTGRYDFLKVDAQGADFQILQGAYEYLHSDCLGVQCELFTLPLYEGITLFDEAVAWMEAQGFVLWRKHSAHGTFASQHDCVFLKREADTRELQRALNMTVPQRSLFTRITGRFKRFVGGRK